MSLKKPLPEPIAIPPPMGTCAVCGAECVDMRINQVTLCDEHFHEWLKLPRNRDVGGQVAMAAYIADAKGKKPKPADHPISIARQRTDNDSASKSAPNGLFVDQPSEAHS